MSKYADDSNLLATASDKVIVLIWHYHNSWSGQARTECNTIKCKEFVIRKKCNTTALISCKA